MDITGPKHVKLLTQRIDIYNTGVQVTEDKILKILEMCYTNTAFSTFPYFYNNLNSEEAITETNSGNCIALSLYVKKKLKNNYGINSCLIPATIPKKYQKPGYLPISHVALLIPIDNSHKDSGFFIADPAFYFLNPIEFRNFNPGIVFSKNIYTREPNHNLKDYTSIDKLLVKLDFFKEDHHFHECQIIEKGTYYVSCWDERDPVDSWKYILTRIINPDEAITYGFFLKEQDGPFITTTETDENNIMQIGGYLKITGNKLTYSKNLKDPQTYNTDTISTDVVNKINNDLYPFLKGNLPQYLKNL